MSHLRGVDRAHDIDEGPSGFAYHGHHFESLWGPSAPARSHRRVLGPRCSYVMRNGWPCDRLDGHKNSHSARA